MVLSLKDIELLLKIANAAAQKAGLLIVSYLNKEIQVNKKSGGDSLASQVVTEVDLLCQKAILEIIELTFIPYNLGLLTEESEDDKSRFEKEYFWCIDPLDGTLPFTEGKSGFAVSIALVSKKGEPIIGLVYDPIKKNLYSTIKGKGVLLNGEPMVLKEESKDTLTLVCDRSFLKQSDYSSIIDRLEQIKENFGLSKLNIISQGGAVMNAIWVIENTPACYFKFPKPNDGGGSLWDFAATACIFNELGLHVGNMNAKPLDLNRADSTFMNHEGVIYSSHESLANLIRNLNS